MEDAVGIEPDGICGEEAMEVLLGIPLLVINEPELAVGASYDAMVTWAEHIPAPVGDGVVGVFDERAGSVGVLVTTGYSRSKL